MINILLDREITFDLPEGTYPAKLSDMKPFTKQSGKGKEDWLRLLFDVSIPGMEDLDCRAGRNFMLSFKSGSDLRNFLAPILEPEFFKTNSAKNIELEEILAGADGLVTLSHFTGKGYDKPMVIVEAFEPVEVEGKD